MPCLEPALTLIWVLTVYSSKWDVSCQHHSFSLLVGPHAYDAFHNELHSLRLLLQARSPRAPATSADVLQMPGSIW